ncbi:MAG TPA: GGDEF domain-containing protein [Pirellulales bacterium]|nr:GGDEF domain-containing protein [Pirellulales bacterium]
MTEPALLVNKSLLQNCLSWFQVDFRQSIVSLVESQFPNYALPGEIQSVLERWEQIRRSVDASSESVDLAALFEKSSAAPSRDLLLFKQIILRYRRQQAARTEGLRERTFHAGIIQTLDQEINSLDAVVGTDWFQRIDELRLPRAKDFLPIQYIEQSVTGQSELAPRQYDEKFHILQAPALFLPDLECFRARCEIRDAPITVAFLDIDDFKSFNSTHGETKIDRNLLPRFMQTVEAHVYQHGFAYRQGGDEYLVLLPSLSKDLALAFLDELRCKLAILKYPDIERAPTVSIGVCCAEPDSPLTDRELRDRANQAKKLAKDGGKNRIATYD